MKPPRWLAPFFWGGQVFTGLTLGLLSGAAHAAALHGFESGTLAP